MVFPLSYYLKSTIINIQISDTFPKYKQLINILHHINFNIPLSTYDRTTNFRISTDFGESLRKSDCYIFYYLPHFEIINFFLFFIGDFPNMQVTTVTLTQCNLELAKKV